MNSLRLIVPKTFVAQLDRPLIFLAGPMRCAPYWQDKATEIIHSKKPEIYLASPRIPKRPECARLQMLGDEAHFGGNLDWERHYLQYASQKGAIMFWLPKPEEHKCNVVYARDTRGELGAWSIRHSLQNARIVVGGEEDYPGYDVTKRNLKADCPDLQIYSTLEETCDAAINLALRK